MAPDSNSERAIGRLEGKLDVLVNAIEDQTEKSETRSGRIYRELEQIRFEQAELRRNQKDLKDRLDADAPTITEIKKWKERLIGMQMTVAFISATFGGALVAGWKWISTKLFGT